MQTLNKIEKIIKKFTRLSITLAIAESCTGGFISHMITNISGASKVFERGVVCYSNEAKIEVLNVNPKDIEEFGAVSEPIANQLAFNIRSTANTHIGIGVTGIAGPTGGTPNKPVGVVYIGYSFKDETIVKKYTFKTDRITFKEEVLKKILDFLEKYKE